MPHTSLLIIIPNNRPVLLKHMTIQEADTDGSRTLSMEEALASAPDDVPPEKVQEHFNMWDQDQDGQLTFHGTWYAVVVQPNVC